MDEYNGVTEWGKRFRIGKNVGQVFDESEFSGTTLVIEIEDPNEGEEILEVLENEWREEAMGRFRDLFNNRFDVSEKEIDEKPDVKIEVEIPPISSGSIPNISFESGDIIDTYIKQSQQDLKVMNEAAEKVRANSDFKKDLHPKVQELKENSYRPFILDGLTHESCHNEMVNLCTENEVKPNCFIGDFEEGIYEIYNKKYKNIWVKGLDIFCQYLIQEKGVSVRAVHRFTNVYKKWVSVTNRIPNVGIEFLFEEVFIEDPLNKCVISMSFDGILNIFLNDEFKAFFEMADNNYEIMLQEVGDFVERGENG